MFAGFRVSVAAIALAGLNAAPAAAQGTDADLPGQAHALRQIISTMESEAAELRPRLEDARATLTRTAREAEEAGAKRDEARAALAALQRDEAAMRDSLARGLAERDSLQAEARAAAAERDQLAARIERAQATLAGLTNQQAALQARLDQSQDLDQVIAERQARADDLARQVRDLSAELAALQRVKAAAAAPAAAETVPAPASVPARSRRDPALVDAALAAAPALPGGQGQARLRDLLVSGECATQALRQVQDPINRQTLLVLVDRLGGCGQP